MGSISRISTMCKNCKNEPTCGHKRMEMLVYIDECKSYENKNVDAIQSSIGQINGNIQISVNVTNESLNKFDVEEFERVLSKQICAPHTR